MSRNAIMMPITVPNRPMNGAAEPVVARNGTIDSSLVISVGRARRSARSMFSRSPSSRWPARWRGRWRRPALGALQLGQLDVAGAEHLRDGAAPSLSPLWYTASSRLALPEGLEEADDSRSAAAGRAPCSR